MEDKIKIHKAITCGEEESIIAISKILKKNNERRIFVVDEKGKLKGLVTTIDLVYKGIAGNKTNKKAKDIMTKNVEHVKHNDSIESALEVMNKTNSYVCPVVEDGKFIGLISHHDILALIASHK
jgi:CBS domain-containing protein